MKQPILWIAAILIAACGGNAEQMDAAPSEVADTTTSDAANLQLWAGDWRVRDKTNGKTVAHLEFRVDGERLQGQYTLTSDFCQTAQPEHSSFCPFIGQGGSWFEVSTNPNTLIATASDPFDPSSDFVVTLFSLDGQTIAMSSIVADAGRVSIDGEVQRAPS